MSEPHASVRDIVLIDLSSIVYRHWHVVNGEGHPDPNAASNAAAETVRRFTSGHRQGVAICCDSGPSFRRELDPSYKAQRQEQEASLFHQLARTRELLLADGHLVWAQRGFEADDLIASAVTRLADAPDVQITIVSEDKDLAQLVTDRVHLKRVSSGDVYGPVEVQAKFGVPPSLLRDYLALCGDKSDNITGAKGVGPVTAAKLLTQFGSLEDAFLTLRRWLHKFQDNVEAFCGALRKKQLPSGADAYGFTPAIVRALVEFYPRSALVRTLVTLRTDVELPIDALDVERVPDAVQEFLHDQADEESEMDVNTPDTPGIATVTTAVAEPADTPATPTAITTTRQPEVLPVATDYRLQLDPRTPAELLKLSAHLYASRMFSAYGSPQAVMSVVMMGRELDLPAMTSLRMFHIIDGKPSPSAALLVSLVLRSGFAEYFEVKSFNQEQATVVTKRKGARREQTYTYTVADAERAGLVKDGSGWMKNPREMCLARAQSLLARLVYPDVVGNLYTVDEAREVAEAAA